MREQTSHHPLSERMAPLDPATWEALWQLFIQIGRFWGNVPEPEPYRTRFQTFITSRMELNPLYRELYIQARHVIEDLIAAHGVEPAYEVLFTDPLANLAPPATPLQFTRQYVSNELIALQLALGGFLAFGALNYPGYFGGGNVPGAPAPYRTMQEEP
ncbi:MAG TPA: hypothetical protein VFP84_40515 [Kofleriaceae bacterium]|nr:hypothetical protein [Kofleriaceae bacterium]